MFVKAVDALVEYLTKLERLADFQEIEVQALRAAIKRHRRELAARPILQEVKR